jgi:ATP-dependent Clp protease ATP-binding subunit ClpA
MASLKDYFRPEFLNRIDDTVIFDILSQDAVREIVKIQVAEVVKRLSDKKIELILSAPALDYLAKEGYNPQYGARPLKRLIQSKILTPVANLLISQEVAKGGAVLVGVKDVPNKPELKDFTFEVRKKHKGESPIIVRETASQK